MRKLKKCYIEITSVCNLACTFCPPTQRQKTFLSVDDFRMRLEQIQGYVGIAGAEGSSYSFSPDNHTGLSGRYLVPYKYADGAFAPAK